MQNLKQSGIYLIISPTHKIYIGQAVDLKRRFTDYVKRPSKRQVKLYRSILKYGWEAHFFSVMELCPIDQLNERERFWQEQWDVTSPEGLNLRLTETSDKCGWLSEETKQRMSEAGKKRRPKGTYVTSEETKMKISDAKKGIGRPHTEEAKIKMSVAKKGKPSTRVGYKPSNETIEKYRQTRAANQLKKLNELTRNT